MDKILVTTDFSVNARGGIIFGFQLAQQLKCALVFYHMTPLLKPTIWSESHFETYKTMEIERLQKALDHLITELMLNNKMSDISYTCEVETGTVAHKSILAYAKAIKAKFICMSAGGTSQFKKILGTNATSLITTSPIPVFMVPSNYKRKPITTIWYASDFTNLTPELHKVKKIAASFAAKTKVIHYNYALHLEDNQQRIQRIIQPFKSKDIKFIFQHLDIETPLADQLQKDLARSKPSILILFTKQNRSWFERLFLSSKTAELTFNTKTPLLILRK
jgi:nucleotide-binding universal stress UspA family protein